ncbi:diacylglycerol kinase family lipid kinase [Rhodococcus sp. BL-253-APC-6A1W]|uniref:diacylglycerol/lipid kinase family protein n=1 Tax=unclassified Rhodococcus (in: high G+C Gram-positive bacteria) TaxID=192944 RepID=UPI00146B21AF|nr:diacylglycerol kinase family protein [Rhodococcus sp. (in: high G+C Gram-positive bacteria)]MBF0661315.1 diacylglycerol kinase family lipid kinase [Rhodococcus sp. (in: high G+C Gram-positive bacteria)]NMD94423.1 diacylglycerol kinase family lipid kinase [Rhodococcus sp. BL-253-APC-6A1W]
MRALLIVNPNATTTTPAGRDRLAHALSGRTQLTVAHTTHRGHAADLARSAHADGMDVVIAHGGDGTVNEIVNGLLGPSPHRGPDPTLPRLAVVPGGSANVFARSLGIAPDPMEATEQLLALLADRTARRIGLGHCDGRWFVFNAGLGLDAQVCEAVDLSRLSGKKATSSRYVRHAITQFFASKRIEPALTLEVPGQDPVAGVYYAFVSNSSPWTFLDRRPVHTNPGTSFGTGLGVFAMATMRVVPSLRVVRQLLAKQGDPSSPYLLRADDVTHVRARSTRPIGLQVDGDYLGLRTDVEFVSVPSILEVVAPAQ